jgi:hypothetical protein
MTEVGIFISKGADKARNFTSRGGLLFVRACKL